MFGIIIGIIAVAFILFVLGCARAAGKTQPKNENPVN